MIKIERILCPTDLSADAERTLRYAVALGREYGAKLFVCHRPEASPRTGLDAKSSKRIEILIEKARAVASNGAQEMASFAWESVLLEGADLASSITREAGTRGAQLIIMRSRRRPLAATVLGSTAETVVRLAPCPVLVMHTDENEWLEEATGALSLKRILVAYDFSSYSELALQYALAMAQRYQAELHLLHVLPAPVMGEPEVSWVGQETNAPYHQAARRLQEAVPAEVYLWCKVKHLVQWGRPHSETLTYARNEKIDLISMGAHGLGFGSDTLFGSNVDRVLRQARCPVLVARPLLEEENQTAHT